MKDINKQFADIVWNSLEDVDELGDDILLESDSIEDIWDENILGEESFGTFYAGNGFKALNNMVMRQPNLLENARILDEKNKPYTVEEFLDLLKKWRIMS